MSPISAANAQTFSSSCTSTAPKDRRVSSAGPVCHVAYIDVTANPNANELARKAADDAARDFKCGKDEVKSVGASGRAVKLINRDR